MGQWPRTGSGKESWVHLKFQEQQEAAAGDDTSEGSWDICLPKHSGSHVKMGEGHIFWHGRGDPQSGGGDPLNQP